MTYRIDPREPVVSEIRRLLHEQLDGAIADLRAPDGPDAAAIHDARQRIKKSRSVLRLARAVLGARVAKQANAELREAARSIAPQRDADARVEAVERILADTHDDDAVRVVLERLRERSAEAAEAQRAAGSVDASITHGAARRLQQTSDWLQRVPAQAEGWDALGSGLRRQYGRGRKQFRRLDDVPSDDDRHDWRKRAKDLWYHERLLRDLWPKAQKPYVKAASHLSDLLGDDHDLSLVRHFVETDSEVDDEDRPTLVATIDARRGALLAEARAVGARLYADRPDAWTDRHGVWWEIESEPSETGGRDQAPPAGTA